MCYYRMVFYMKIKIKETAFRKKGWSLYRLAKELNLPQQTIYSWAGGRTQPSYENMDKLCTVLNCLMSEIFEPELRIPEELDFVVGN